MRYLKVCVLSPNLLSEEKNAEIDVIAAVAAVEAVTKEEDDRYKFKVPTLRNVAITGPYFHDGGVSTLNFAVRKMAYMQLGLELSTEQTEAIVAFLGALTDKGR